MTAGLVLDWAIVALLGVAVVVGLVALRVHALDHPQQRSDPPSRRSSWGAIFPIALSALFQARLIGEAAPAVRGTTAACGAIAVVLLFVAAEVWNRDARRRIEGVPRGATPGRIVAAVLVAGALLAAGVASTLLGTPLGVTLGVPIGIAAAVLVVLALARGWRRFRPARFEPHP